LASALAVGLCAIAVAQDKKADPVGTWKCEYEIGGQRRESTLTVKKDGDKFAGTMRWPDQNETKLADLKVKDGELTFSAERQFMDTKFTVKYTLKVEGDTIKGKGETDFGGETLSFDIAGKRETKGEAKDAKKGK